ncbi:MAG: type IV secretion system protein VirJ [Novosphingobium sp.]|nr:type IV secretion system protein VirJ [Novosphingobium sp.]
MNALARRPARRWHVWAGGLAIVLAVLANAPRLGLLGWDRHRTYAAAPLHGSPLDGSPLTQTAVVFLSGDMGLDLGMSGDLAHGLAAHGYRVTGVSSPVAFAQHRTRAEAMGVVTDAIGSALGAGADRVVLAGQSYGADIIAAVVPDLPAPLRRKIAGVVMVVPADSVYLRADPTGIAYLGAPDIRPAAALGQVNWVPVSCIHGDEETQSLCPLLHGPRQHAIALPGNHYLQHDARRVLATMLGAIAAMRRPA